MHYIDSLIQNLYSLPVGLIYLFLGIGAFTENICPPIPGDTIIAFGAFLAGRNKLNFLIAYLSTTIGSLAGFMCVFYIGIYLGSRFSIERDLLFLKRMIYSRQKLGSEIMVI